MCKCKQTGTEIGKKVVKDFVHGNHSTPLLHQFHLMNHAFLKALLSLGAGSVIHALPNKQDMRQMGGIVPLPPFTYAMMLIASLSGSHIKMESH